MLGLGALGLFALAKSQENEAEGLPEGELTFVNGSVTGAPYMVVLGPEGDTGQQLVSVFNTNKEFLLVYSQKVDGSGRTLLNLNTSLEKQARTAATDFGL